MSSPLRTKKVAHTRLPSVGFRSWSRFLAVSLQVTWVIIPAVGCHYFSPGLQLPPQPLRGLLPISLLGEQWLWAVCLRLLTDSVATAIWTRAVCAWVQHANHSVTEPPSCEQRWLYRPRKWAGMPKYVHKGRQVPLSPMHLTHGFLDDSNAHTERHIDWFIRFVELAVVIRGPIIKTS